MLSHIRNICLAAHVDAGKTSLAEQILFQTGAVRKIGSVDQGSSYFDASPIEIRRGVTIFSEYASVIWRDCKINLIDTPGHADFVAELERSLSVADGAVILLSATEGVEQHTELVWDLAQARQIPVFFFINKADVDEADIQGVFRQISRDLTADAVLLQDHEKLGEQGSAYPNLIEFLAERDNLLLQKYLENEPISRPPLQRRCGRLFGTGIFSGPLWFGANGMGVSSLLDYLVEFMPPPNLISLSAPLDKTIKIFKIKNEDKSGKLAYIKVLAGEVQIRDSFFYSRNEECKVAQPGTNPGFTARRQGNKRRSGDKSSTIPFPYLEPREDEESDE
jgi:small GTP-binding protein